MRQIDSIEHDLLEMKAGTLYKYGKKVELAEEMLIHKLALKKRLEKILKRLKSEQIIKTGWRKQKRQLELTNRVECKIKRTETTVEKLVNLKNKYIEDFKLQREACGLIDHSFLDKYYHEKETKEVNNE